MRCYFDGSEKSGDGDQWMTLFGLVAGDNLWAVFQKDWDEMLKSRYPIAPFLHMTELVTSNDPFERCAGWTEGRKKQLVHDASGVLNSFHKDRLCAVYCTINMSARSRLFAEGIEIADPAAICTENCVHQAAMWHMRENPFEIAYLFFDQDEPYMPKIYNRWRTHERQRIKHHLWGMIGNMVPVDMRYTPPIQAADLGAWAISRAHRNEPGDEWAKIAPDLVWTKDASGSPHPGMLTTSGMVIDEAAMRRNCDKLHPSRRKV